MKNRKHYISHAWTVVIFFGIVSLDSCSKPEPYHCPKEPNGGLQIILDTSDVRFMYYSRDLITVFRDSTSSEVDSFLLKGGTKIQRRKYQEQDCKYGFLKDYADINISNPSEDRGLCNLVITGIEGYTIHYSMWGELAYRGYYSIMFRFGYPGFGSDTSWHEYSNYPVGKMVIDKVYMRTDSVLINPIGLVDIYYSPDYGLVKYRLKRMDSATVMYELDTAYFR